VVGGSPIGYSSSSQEVHHMKPVTINDPKKRHEMRNSNNATNFVDTGVSFERKVGLNTSDAIPSKVGNA